MHTRQQAHPDRPPHRLRHPPLIDTPQAGLAPMLDPPTRPTELPHHRKILILVQRVDPQHIEHIARRPSPSSCRPGPFPLRRLRGRQIVRRVHLPLHPRPRLLPLQVDPVTRFFQVPDRARPRRRRHAGQSLRYPCEAFVRVGGGGGLGGGGGGGWGAGAGVVGEGVGVAGVCAREGGIWG